MNDLIVVCRTILDAQQRTGEMIENIEAGALEGRVARYCMEREKQEQPDARERGAGGKTPGRFA
jgi:hypothetical protein